MRTSKAIATISFNTPAYLRQKLEELKKAGKLSFWAFIVHKPEDDEGGKKEHIHLYAEPSKMIQTDDLKEELKELDPSNPSKPLGCISWVSSKFDPWYLYALHDKRYLATKSQSRQYHYQHEDIESSDPDDLTFKSKSIDLLSLSPYADMEDAQSQGVTWAEYFHRGTVPLPQVALFERAWWLLQEARTERAGREGHPNELPDETPSESEKTPSESEKLPEGVTVNGEVLPDSLISKRAELYRQREAKAQSPETKWSEWTEEDELPFDERRWTK